MDNVQVKTMDETIGAQLARKEKDTGEKQKAGALFKKLDVNGNGLLERSESDEVCLPACLYTYLSACCLCYAVHSRT